MHFSDIHHRTKSGRFAVPLLKRENPREICSLTSIESKDPIILVNHFLSFTKLTQITTWVMRFMSVILTSTTGIVTSPLLPQKWKLTSNNALPSNCSLLCLNLFVGWWERAEFKVFISSCTLNIRSQNLSSKLNTFDFYTQVPLSSFHLSIANFTSLKVAR